MSIKETEYLSKRKNLGIFFLIYKSFINKNLLIILYLIFFKSCEKHYKRILEKLSHELIKENLGGYDI